MISPLVRRRRLAAEVITLREAHGYSAQRLAGAIDVARASISRLENGHVAPDLDLIRQILALFDVDEQRSAQLIAIAREAQERGWWARHTDQMGPRQALYANLEAGAASISEYQLTLLPGLLQIPPYTEARLHTNADRDAHPARFDPTQALRARATRQQVLTRPGGPTYHVVIDELALRRTTASTEILRAQFDHLVHTGHDHEKITIQVLPVAATIIRNAPRSAFSCYRYPNGDPTVVAVDTITSDLVLTDIHDADEVRRYTDLHERLTQAALAPTDSLDFLAAMAEDLAHHRKEPHDPAADVHHLAQGPPQRSG